MFGSEGERLKNDAYQNEVYANGSKIHHRESNSAQLYQCTYPMKEINITRYGNEL